jgi:DNA-binding PadR family transcriptional regulator
MMFIDVFSGDAAYLPKGQRNSENVLQVLAKHPLVSTWDMSELSWLRAAIEDLEQHKFIVELDEPYPWHRYALTDAGRAVLENRVVV